MQAVSGINQALAIRNAPAELAANVAVAQKNLQAVEKAGDAVVKLLDKATDVTRKVDFRA